MIESEGDYRQDIGKTQFFWATLYLRSLIYIPGKKMLLDQSAVTAVYKEQALREFGNRLVMG